MTICPNCKTKLKLVVDNTSTVPVPPVPRPKPTVNFDSRLSIKTVVLDAGHGAPNPVNGDRSEAMTRVYKFPHNGQVIYEGVINRMYTKEIKRQLVALGFNVIETAPNHIDTSLNDRVAIANRQESASSYFLSIHNNGSATHTASGTEGFTTPGQNRSDDVMEKILLQMMKHTRVRSSKSDGDLDKEANYYVIKHSKLRAGLLEIGFYDNWDEYLKLTNETYIKKISTAIVQGIVDYNNSL